MKAIERLYIYIDYKGMKPTRFEKEIGLSNGYLGTQFRRKGNLGEDILNLIVDNCLDLNSEWLLTGKGEMLKNIAKEADADLVKENKTKYGEDNESVKNIYKQNLELKNTVADLKSSINQLIVKQDMIFSFLSSYMKSKNKED